MGPEWTYAYFTPHRIRPSVRACTTMLKRGSFQTGPRSTCRRYGWNGSVGSLVRPVRADWVELPGIDWEVGAGRDE